jgi:hypothetical protein
MPQSRTVSGAFPGDLGIRQLQLEAQVVESRQFRNAMIDAVELLFRGRISAPPTAGTVAPRICYCF